MSNKPRLELTWIGKDKHPKLEPRILLEDSAKSYHANHRVSDNDIFDNRLIFGDNLLALKALEAEFAGKVKCVFIDPPYNTGSAFKHYDDGLEHSIWLGLMRDRLEIFKRLLADDGSIWITIDDNECHYLKVLCDEVFGRVNFVANVVWQKKYAATNDSTQFSNVHDHILVYAKEGKLWRPNLVARSDELNSKYTNPDNDPRGVWYPTNLSVKTYSASNDYEIISPAGITFRPPPTRAWVVSKTKYEELLTDNRISFGKKGDSRPYKKTFLSEVQQGVVPITLWEHEFAGHNIGAKSEIRTMFGNRDDLFDTPKPELLLSRVIHLATVSGDLVLDSFAGSGTTGAVAHKMGRRWIMVELGEHCHTHIIPRMQKVVDGEDRGGVSDVVGWQGGGGFRYYSLAPSLIVNDAWGNPVINPEYNPAQLAEAIAKLEGFSYAPSETQWWQHGHSSERDFLYVTTQNLSAEQLQALSEEVGEEQSLLLCCSAFHGVTGAKASERWPNLTLKKIPKMVLARCEWGHDDYSLNVANLPMSEREQEPAPPVTRASRKKTVAEPDLFGEGE